MDQTPAASSKRPRNEVEDDEPAHLDPKRRKEGTPVELATKSAYLTVHCIRCAGGSYHSHHYEDAYYLDVPRLFARDTKAKGLRGAKPIEDLEQYLEEHPSHDFVVIKDYSCEAYYEDHEGEFQEIGDSELRTKISREQRAYLYTLLEDLPLATPKDEYITHFSQDMAKALNALDVLCQWDGAFDTHLPEDLELKAPYTIVYHSRTSLNDYRERGIDPIHWPRIDGFRDYVLESMSDDYAEADAHFEKREITVRHLAKLFRKGDVVVTKREGEEVGLLFDLSLRNIKEVTWDKNAFQDLVMDEKKKKLLEALVVVQGDRSQNKVPDVIEGKGNGLILLLHGPPGIGKTLTAESVAERAQKPLYRVTCGDIGTHPEKIERYLESVLFIGKTWDCVVLLDEADIFLEERSPSDLKRNALVSIFLRVLEYYEGILILTTNRVGTFDEAFKSRIQLAVHYPSLKRSDREQIWKLIIDSIKKKSEVEVTDNQLFRLAEHPLNGRQIRNTIKTASQQAFYQKSCLTYGHLQTAIDVANEFENYIFQARGQTDEERAEDIMARAPERRE